MRRRDRRGSRRGLLLVEAVLSAVVIAVGLVFISRTLGEQLGAIHRLEVSDVRLALVRSKLLEWESLRLAGLLLPERRGAFPGPFADYQWVGGTTPRADVTKEDGTVAAVDVSVTIERAEQPGSSLTLTTIWPSAWALE